MVNRRRFIAASSAAALSTSLSGCMGSGMQGYERAAAELRSALPPNPEILDFIRFATLAANGHNAQPWRFAIRGARTSILPDLGRRTAAVDPDDHHLYTSLGCAAENFLITAAASGRPGAMDIATEGDGQIDIDLARRTQQENALFDAITERQSTRSDFDGRPVSPDDIRLLANTARIDGVALEIFTSSEDREAILDHVIAGNSVQMDDPAFVRELRDSIRFNAAEALHTRDGLFSACSGNPTMSGWLGRRLFNLLYRKGAENDKYASQLRTSAGVAVFIGERADIASWIHVGRSFQRFALQATALGIRHSHINQPVEVPSVRTEFAQWLGNRDARPDLVIRFGNAPALPMSLRRPVADVLITDTA